jgi:nucleoside-diphosphate-sugar epimerase
VTGAHRDRPVLVTGAGGFLGAALVRRLVELGARVRALVGPAAAPELLAPPPDVVAAYGDLTEPRVLDGLFDPSHGELACVYHLAGPPSVVGSFAEPARYLQIHAGGTAAVLERCIAARVARLVYVSSAEVYGVVHGPVTEEHPRQPRSPYGAAKLAAELVLESCAAVGGVQATVLRPFSIYGPGAGPRSLIAGLVAAAVRGEPSRVADPAPVRDYCFVSDAIEAIVRGGDRDGLAARAYNIASGRGTSVEDVARAVLRAAGRGELAVLPAAPDRPAAAMTYALIGNPARARDELGFRAEITLDDGLARTLRAWRTSAAGEAGELRTT